MDKKQLSNLIESIASVIQKAQGIISQAQGPQTQEATDIDTAISEQPPPEVGSPPTPPTSRHVAVPKGVVEALIKNEISQIVSEAPLVTEDEEAVLLVSPEKDVAAEASLAKSKVMYLADFRKAQTAHGMSDEERKALWPRKKKLYSTDVSHAEEVQDPNTIGIAPVPDYPEGLPFTAQVQKHELTCQDTIASINGIIGKAEALQQSLPPLADQAEQYLSLTEDDITYIRPTMGAVCGVLANEFRLFLQAADLEPEPQPQAVQVVSAFSLAEALVSDLATAEKTLPAETKLAAIADDASKKLALFASKASDMTAPDAAPLDLVDHAPKEDILAGTAGPTAIFQKAVLTEGPQVPLSLDAALEPFGDGEDIYLPKVRKDFDKQVLVDKETLVSLIKQDSELPIKGDTTYESVVQVHCIGKTAHTDFRIKTNDHLVGYTLLVQKAGKLDEITTLAQAKDIANDFAVKGSWWNKAFLGNARVRVSVKEEHPSAWLSVKHKVFQPGEAGASKYKSGFMVAVARPRVTIGLQTETFHEFFLEKDDAISGRLVLRLQASSNEDDPAFWTASLPNSLLPAILQKKTLSADDMPPQGWSFLPPKLKAVVPKQFRYWLADVSAERAEIRNALVEEKFFTKNNLKMLDGAITRVVSVHNAYEPKDDTGIFKALSAPIPQAQLFSPCVSRQALAKSVCSLLAFGPVAEPFFDTSGGAFFVSRDGTERSFLNVTDYQLADAFMFLAKEGSAEELLNKNWMGRRSLFEQLLAQPSTTTEATADDAYRTLYIQAFRQRDVPVPVFDPNKSAVLSDIPQRLNAVRKAMLNGLTSITNFEDPIEAFKELEGCGVSFLVDVPDGYSDTEELCAVLSKCRDPFLAVSKERLPLEGLCCKMLYHDRVACPPLYITTNYELEDIQERVSKAAAENEQDLMRPLFNLPACEPVSTTQFELCELDEGMVSLSFISDDESAPPVRYQLMPEEGAVWKGHPVADAPDTAVSHQGTAKFTEQSQLVDQFTLATGPNALPVKWQGSLVLEKSGDEGVILRRRHSTHTNPPPAAFYDTLIREFREDFCKINSDDLSDVEKVCLLTKCFGAEAVLAKGVSVRKLCAPETDENPPVVPVASKSELLPLCKAACVRRLALCLGGESG
jgi:hypothetical protein